MNKRTEENDNQYIPVYIDEDGEGFVDLVRQQFGNTDEYDEVMEERIKEMVKNEQRNS